MKSKETIYIVVSIIILVVLAFGAYWYFLMGPVTVPASPSTSNPTGFEPLDRTGTTGQGTNSGTNTTGTATTATSSPTTTTSAPLTTLRLLSAAPVGGYGASTTARTTVVRWVDRGRGNVYEASYDSAAVTTISNTVVPRIYESAWNRNLTAFVGSIFQDGDASWMAVYSQLIAQSTASPATASDPSQLTPFSLRGKKLPASLIGYAVSPRKDKLVMLANENGGGVGYVSNLDGSATTRIFTTPLTQVNVTWPSDNIIAITTKGSASYSGFLYFVNPRTGTWTQILGPIRGLSSLVSHDGKYVLWSGTGSGGKIVTDVYSVANKTTADIGVSTLAEKCAWGNLYTTVAYCAVPSSIGSGTYPDDWYQGKLSTADAIWQIDAPSGNVKLLSSPIEQSSRIIDGFNLDLDSKDSYLFLMNKNDLSLWSLDLAKAQ